MSEKPKRLDSREERIHRAERVFAERGRALGIDPRSPDGMIEMTGRHLLLQARIAVSSAILAHLLSLGLDTVQKRAQHLGVSGPTMSRIEGMLHDVSLDTLFEYAGRLGLFASVELRDIADVAAEVRKDIEAERGDTTVGLSLWEPRLRKFLPSTQEEEGAQSAEAALRRYTLDELQLRLSLGFDPASLHQEARVRLERRRYPIGMLYRLIAGGELEATRNAEGRIVVSEASVQQLEQKWAAMDDEEDRSNLP